MSTVVNLLNTIRFLRTLVGFGNTKRNWCRYDLRDGRRRSSVASIITLRNDFLKRNWLSKSLGDTWIALNVLLCQRGNVYHLKTSSSQNQNFLKKMQSPFSKAFSLLVRAPNKKDEAGSLDVTGNEAATSLLFETVVSTEHKSDGLTTVEIATEWVSQFVAILILYV